MLWVQRNHNRKVGGEPYGNMAQFHNGDMDNHRNVYLCARNIRCKEIERVDKDRLACRVNCDSYICSGSTFAFLGKALGNH